MANAIPHSQHVCIESLNFCAPGGLPRVYRSGQTGLCWPSGVLLDKHDCRPNRVLQANPVVQAKRDCGPNRVLQAKPGLQAKRDGGPNRVLLVKRIKLDICSWLHWLMTLMHHEFISAKANGKAAIDRYMYHNMAREVPGTGLAGEIRFFWPNGP